MRSRWPGPPRTYLATLTGQGYSPVTVRLYRENLAQFAEFLGAEPTLADFTLERARCAISSTCSSARGGRTRWAAGRAVG